MGNSDFNNLNQTIGELLTRAYNLSKPLKEIGMIMIGEMKKNFEVGGRPNAWPISKRVKRRGGQTLRDSGTLMNSITMNSTEDRVEVGPTAVGKNHLTDPRILAALNFGATIQRHARSELFLRNRKSKGVNKGQFKVGTKFGKGMTFGASVTKIFPYNYTYIPDEAGVTFGQILQNHVLGQPS